MTTSIYSITIIICALYISLYKICHYPRGGHFATCDTYSHSLHDLWH